MANTTPARRASGQYLSPVLEEPEEAPEELLLAAAVSPLDGWLSFLTKAARNSWELPTSQVQILLGGQTPRDHLLQIRVHLPACWEAWPGDQLEGGAVAFAFILTSISVIMLRNIAVVSLVLVNLSGCQQVEKFMGWPQHLDNAGAAVHYLDLVCPANHELERLSQAEKKNQRQAKAGEITSKEWGKAQDSLLLANASRAFRFAQAKTDPRFIWPESVRSLMAEMSAAQMEIVSASRAFVREGGFTAASKEEGPWPDSPGEEAAQRVADKASAIRTSLRLPARSEGCKNGKRFLTLNQIKKLQGT